MNISTTQNLRRINKDKVLKALHDLGECHKKQLSEYTSLSLGTCTNILKELLESQEVVMGEEFESTGGRKAKSYKLNGNYSKILTISLHREYHVVYYMLRVYNLTDDLLYEKVSEPTVLDFQDFCEDITEVFQQFENIKVISISIPGVVSQNGCIDEVSLRDGLEDLKDIQIVKELTQKYDVKVLIDNDVNIAAIGYYQHHKDLSHMGFIYQPLDELAGAAVIANGYLQRGKHHFVGELPFLPILTRKKQFENMETKEGHIHLLSLFIMTMIVMNDPDVICISCQLIDDTRPLIKEMKKYLPYPHLLPELRLIGDINHHIFNGLLEISHEALSSNLVMTKQSIFE